MLIIFLFAGSISANAQDNLPLMHHQLCGEVFVDNYNIYKGSPNLFESYAAVKLRFKNGETLELSKGNYNQHQDELLVYHSFLKKLVLVDKNSLYGFETQGKYFELVSLESKKAQYLEVLYNGKIRLYNQYYCVIITSENNVHEKHIMGRLKAKKQSLLVLPGNDVKKVKISRNGLIKAFPKHKKVLRQYMRNEKIKLKNKADLQKLLQYMENLNNY